MAGNEFPTVKDVFTDFKGHRAGLIKAFTTDVEKFASSAILSMVVSHCVDVFTGKEKLCLFGFPNETGEVMQPVETLPPDLPEPIFGINFAKDRMQEKESKVAILSDLWLLSIAFCYAAVSKFGKSGRNRLFQLINDLPTIAEVVTEAMDLAKDAAAAAHDNNSNNRSRGKTSLQLRPPEKAIKMFTSNQRRGKN